MRPLPALQAHLAWGLRRCSGAGSLPAPSGRPLRMLPPPVLQATRHSRCPTQPLPCAWRRHRCTVCGRSAHLEPLFVQLAGGARILLAGSVGQLDLPAASLCPPASPLALQRRQRRQCSPLLLPAERSPTRRQAAPAGREARDSAAAAAARRPLAAAARRAAKLRRCLRAALGSWRRGCAGGRATVGRRSASPCPSRAAPAWAGRLLPSLCCCTLPPLLLTCPVLTSRPHGVPPVQREAPCTWLLLQFLHVNFAVQVGTA